MSYEDYKERIAESIRTCKEEMGVQPILFFGSGMSQRYAKTPTWLGLLSILCNNCPKIKMPISYFQQQHSSMVNIGTELAGYYREWAWEEQERYPEDLFLPGVKGDAYIKYDIARFFEEEIVSDRACETQKEYEEEIELLKRVKPYAVITTNYDRFLERVFDDYSPVIGQEIIRSSFTSIGEIIKMHGCASQPDSLVFSKDDYDDFLLKKKYLSAKLLTYFAEHPVFIMGYSAQDENVKSILSDIDEIISHGDEVIPNIFIVEFDQSAESTGKHRSEAIIQVGGDRSLRVNNIVASDFSWIYDVLGENHVLEGVNPKVLRAVLARTYNMIRCDIPRQKVEVDFKTLEQASSEEGFAKLFGVTPLDDPAHFNASFPYSLTDVGMQLGYKGWHQADRLIKIIEEKEGVNIKASNNSYHVAVRSGQKGCFHKYSAKAVDLLHKVQNGMDYVFEP